MFVSHSETEVRPSTVSAPAELVLDLGIATIEAASARAPYGSPRMNVSAQKTILTLVGAPARA